MTTPKDKVKYILNPFTGNFDAVLQFNADRIVTSFVNAAGNRRLIWDDISGTFIEDGPKVVVNNAGNVVVT